MTLAAIPLKRKKGQDPKRIHFWRLYLGETQAGTCWRQVLGKAVQG